MVLNYHDITTLDDPLYDDYLDLYQRAFPLNEQLLVSEFNGTLRRKMRGEASDQRLVAALAEDGSLVGMSLYAVKSESRAGMLWYLAVSERLRGHGAGSNLYLEILNRVRNEFPSAAGLVFEVERPDQAQTAELGALAERRIRFYQRNGALLLEGVHYVQCTGWQPEVAMHLMVHPFITMSALAAFDLCSSVFGDSLCAAGDLSLVAAD